MCVNWPLRVVKFPIAKVSVTIWNRKRAPHLWEKINFSIFLTTQIQSPRNRNVQNVYLNYFFHSRWNDQVIVWVESNLIGNWAMSFQDHMSFWHPFNCLIKEYEYHCQACIKYINKTDWIMSRIIRLQLPELRIPITDNNFREECLPAFW